jgi:hypothetical protein
MTAFQLVMSSPDIHLAKQRVPCRLRRLICVSQWKRWQHCSLRHVIPAFGDRLTMEMPIVLSVPLNGKTCDPALEGQGY